MVLLWNTSVIQDTLYKATVGCFVIRMDNGDLLLLANKVPHFFANNLNAYNFHNKNILFIIMANLDVTFLQYAPAVVHQAFQTVPSIQDREHITAVLLWTTPVIQDSLYKATVE